MSAIAKLVYGIRVPEGSLLHDRLVNPDEDDFGQPLPGISDLYNKGKEDSGVEVVYTGNDSDSDNLRLVLGVSVSKLVAWPYDSTEVTSLAVDSSWDATLRAFCTKHSIDWIKPRWWFGCWDN